MHTDSGMTGISLSGYMPYMTVASLEMSDEPHFSMRQNAYHIEKQIFDTSGAIIALFLIKSDIPGFRSACFRAVPGSGSEEELTA